MQRANSNNQSRLFDKLWSVNQPLSEVFSSRSLSSLVSDQQLDIWTFVSPLLLLLGFRLRPIEANSGKVRHIHTYRHIVHSCKKHPNLSSGITTVWGLFSVNDSEYGTKTPRLSQRSIICSLQEDYYNSLLLNKYIKTTYLSVKGYISEDLDVQCQFEHFQD